jgi:glycosyltransferase involved in cell wall biosynthesis
MATKVAKDARRKRHAQRIAVVAHKDYPGGVRERREIDALVAAGYEVDLICLHQRGQPFKESRERLRIYRMPLGHKRTGKLRFILEYLLFFVLAFTLLSLLHFRRRFRLIQIHNIPDFLVFSALVPKICGSRILLDIRDPMPETYQFKFGLSEDSRWIDWMKRIERVSVRFSDYVLTVHEPLRQIHIKRGCPSDRISAIMNLPDEQVFQLETSVKWPRSTPPEFVLVYTGTLGERHGVQTVLQALPCLIDDIPGLRLRVIGDGEYLEELKNLTASLKLNSHVSFVPSLPLDEIPGELLKADVGVCLQQGLFGDIAFPTKVAEYMVMGVPAIVSETKITRQFFTKAMVVFVPPGDPKACAEAVYRLYADSQYARYLLVNGERFFKEHSWADEKQKYLEIVERLTVQRNR